MAVGGCGRAEMTRVLALWFFIVGGELVRTGGRLRDNVFCPVRRAFCHVGCVGHKC